METKKPEFKELKLADIVVSKSNPRKEFDEESLFELAESIRENGVLQPIVVRPKDGKHELVCGERRYRASMLVKGAIKTRDTIPAVVREMTDEEALELQIIENLQRKDVHPMEEAVAFKNLIEYKKLAVPEIAKRVGKNPKYVAERLKLNELIDQFQKAFYKNRMTLVTAMKICKLSPDDQKDFWDDEGDLDGQIQMNDYTMKRYIGDLSNAPFDIADPDLHKKMGACTNCQFNTASNTLLFPEAAHSSKCMNSSCYKQKSIVSFDQELKKAMDDTTIELVSDDWNMGKAARDLIAKGHKVHQKSIGYTSIDRPEMEDISDYEERLEDQDFSDRKEMEKEYQEDLEQHKKELAAYEKSIASGKYIRAFVVEGNDKGKYIYITLKAGAKQASSAQAIKNKSAEGKVSAADINEEIKRLQDREKRAKELDLEKINVELCEILPKQKNFTEGTGALKHSEKIGLIILMTEFANWDTRNKIYRKVGCSARSGDDYKFIKLYNHLDTMVAAGLESNVSAVARIVMTEKLVGQASGSDVSGKAAVLERILSDYNLKAVKDIIQEREEAATTRALRMEDKITGLKAQLKDLPGKEKKVAPKKESKVKKKKRKGLSALLN